MPFGELVDLHSIETTEDGIGYEDMDCYISDDGLSGFAITKDGDLVSVFNTDSKRGFLKAISNYIKPYVSHMLKCYDKIVDMFKDEDFN